MRTPQLLLSPEWPVGREHWLANLIDGPSFQLWWPVAYLPVELGWIATAHKLAEDWSGQYFVLMGVAFYSDHIALYGVEENPDGNYPETDLSYETLAYLIAEADSGVAGQTDPPPAMRVFRPHESRAYRAFLCLRDPIGPTDDETQRDTDELPF